jgi:1-acyl-sn-glycerol-3-phosphate acyltransferase
MFAKIRFYWGAFVISFIVAVLMIPAITIFPKYTGLIMHKLNSLIMLLMGAKLDITGEYDAEADMLLINHQGIMDIVAIEAFRNHDICWVAKKELFETPWFGYIMKNSGMISLDRGSRSGLIKLLKDVKHKLGNEHRQIAIFPEGTRAKEQKLLKFKQGAQMIANKLNLKVQPVIVTGSKWVLNEHNRTGHSGTIHIEFLPTIEVAKSDDSWYDELYTTMQQKIDDQYNKNQIER